MGWDRYGNIKWIQPKLYRIVCRKCPRIHPKERTRVSEWRGRIHGAYIWRYSNSPKGHHSERAERYKPFTSGYRMDHTSSLGVSNMGRYSVRCDGKDEGSDMQLGISNIKHNEGAASIVRGCTAFRKPKISNLGRDRPVEHQGGQPLQGIIRHRTDNAILQALQ